MSITRSSSAVRADTWTKFICDTKAGVILTVAPAMDAALRQARAHCAQPRRVRANPVAFDFIVLAVWEIVQIRGPEVLVLSRGSRVRGAAFVVRFAKGRIGAITVHRLRVRGGHLRRAEPVRVPVVLKLVPAYTAVAPPGRDTNNFVTVWPFISASSVSVLILWLLD